MVINLPNRFKRELVKAYENRKEYVPLRHSGCNFDFAISGNYGIRLSIRKNSTFYIRQTMTELSSQPTSHDWWDHSSSSGIASSAAAYEKGDKLGLNVNMYISHH